jgi:hypothetical protein
MPYNDKVVVFVHAITGVQIFEHLMSEGAEEDVVERNFNVHVQN